MWRKLILGALVATFLLSSFSVSFPAASAATGAGGNSTNNWCGNFTGAYVNVSFSLIYFNASHIEIGNMTGFFYNKLIVWNSSDNLYELQYISSQNGNLSKGIENQSVVNRMGETLFNGVNYSILNQLNTGINPSKSSISNLTEGVTYTTSMGSLTVDELNTSYDFAPDYVNISMYVDQKSGLLVGTETDSHFVNSVLSNRNISYSVYTSQLTATNINTTLAHPASNSNTLLYIAIGVGIAVVVAAVSSLLAVRKRKSR